MARPSKRSLGLAHSMHRIIAEKASEMRARGAKLIDFSIGQPGLPPHEGALKDFVELIRENPFELYRYPPSQGLLALREALSADLRKYGGVDVDPSNIVITTGGLEALVAILYATTDEGDTVLLPEPCYSMYFEALGMLGARAETCPQRLEHGFQPDVECLKAKAPRARAIMLASPDNPTSRVISEDIAKAIADLSEDHDLWVVYDVAYKHVTYEAKHVWLEKVASDPSRIIVVGSFSKDIAIPGGRLGYAYAFDREIVEHVVKVRSVISIGAPTPSQWLAYIALTKYKDEYLRHALEVYRKRRDVAYDFLTRLLPEARVMKPTAGIYLFPDLSPYLRRKGLDDVGFALELIEKAGVVVLPGSAFGPSGKGHVRITFATNNEDDIREGLRRMAEFLLS
ncbi:MAG: pyridoxal phosphate-dependent aminotransferase [Desulfurococcaceae archaeon]